MAGATLTIRNLDPQLKERLRVRAAQNGQSMEDEVRSILRAAVTEPEVASHGLGTAIWKRFRKLGGVELAPPEREPAREPPRLR